MDSIDIQSEEIMLGQIQGTHLNMYCCPICKYIPSIKIQEYGRTEIQCANCHYGPENVSVKDLLEEIVGDIKDEYDADEREAIKEVGEREFQIEGSMNLDDINDKLGISLESENYDSLGGLIIENLDDTLPEEGQEVTLADGTKLVVESFTDNRINTVRLTLPEPVVSEEEEEQVEDNN